MKKIYAKGYLKLSVLGLCVECLSCYMEFIVL